jgi:deoxycytidylate deaminase
MVLTMSKDYLSDVIELAKLATCLRAKCGVVIVKDGEITGRGYNSPAGEVEEQRMCEVDRSSTVKPKYDRTCCMHAEWRAILGALKNNPEKVPGSTLHFIRLNAKTNEIIPARELFCTVCSRMILDVGIKTIVLYSEDDQVEYEAQDYNLKSYQSLLPDSLMC